MTKKVIDHKGLTVKNHKEDIYDKAHIGLEFDLPDEADEATIATTMIRMRALIEQELGSPNISQIPQVNTEKIMQHKWKGRKISDDKYADGSLSWGWDFASEFPKEIIQLLEKGPLHIDEYEIALNEGKNLVHTKKRKK